ncbi:MAG: aryl-sulfate sulfotransferase [Solirubrobacterales bacterium]
MDFASRATRVGSGKQQPRVRALGIVVAALLTIVMAGCAGSFTKSASNVTDTTATLRGSVSDPDDATVSYWFEYGPTKAYGSETTHRSIVINDRDSHDVSEDLSGLDPGTTYHFRTCAKEPVTVCAADRSFTTTGGATVLSITADPELYPDFDPTINDYVMDCAGGPIEMTVVAPADTEVAVDGEDARNGTFTTEVPLQANQRFSFDVSTGAGNTTHHVRCLPDDFPEWTFEEFGAADWQWYIVAPSTGGPRYTIVFDGHGVPVWWFQGTGGDSKYLDDGTLAWVQGTMGNDPRYQIRALDGTLLNTVRTVDTELDDHDLQLLPNGNYMVMSYKPRAGTVDLTAYGGPADAAVLDAELQEVEPDGDLVWSWNSETHIGLDETDHWWDDFVLANPTRFGPGHDVVHINSVEVTNGSVVASMRHTDGIYKIDRSTGDIVWKLGGTTTPESLTVIGDPLGADPLGGQHDARILDDGTLTVHDNGTNKSRPPRAVRYQIDESAGTATLLESVSDPDAPAANCCGSARRSALGSWVAAWGGLGVTEHPVSEFKADGTQTFKLLFPGEFSYRANPVPFGELGRADLRDGMDAQHPR